MDNTSEFKALDAALGKLEEMLNRDGLEGTHPKIEMRLYPHTETAEVRQRLAVQAITEGLDMHIVKGNAETGQPLPEIILTDTSHIWCTTPDTRVTIHLYWKDIPRKMQAEALALIQDIDEDQRVSYAQL